MTLPPGLFCIDAQYINPERMAVYLLIEEDRAAFVDINTERALPHLLAALDAQGLTPDAVDYIFLTHVHLDHSAGAAQLLAACPNATLVAHPKAARHIIQPERLVAGSRAVYGDHLFGELYGEVQAAPAGRVRTVEDGDTITWGSRKLHFLHTLGHATHHYCMFDAASRCVFTGDNFGIGRTPPQRPGNPFLLCTCTPPEFDAPEALKSIGRIVDTGATHAAIAHFGVFENVAQCAPMVRRSTERMGEIVEEALASGLEGHALDGFIGERVYAAADDQLRWCGVEDFEADRSWLDADLALNVMGLVAAVKRRRKAAG